MSKLGKEQRKFPLEQELFRPRLDLRNQLGLDLCSLLHERLGFSHIASHAFRRKIERCLDE